jgi:O-antigen/teichoic acid export membrane protein
MLLILVVSLYTSRIVLSTLGIQDFGIYNVVAGFVTMLSFFNSSMSTATQRFLSFEIGRKDENRFTNVFCMSMNIHLIIAIIIFFLAESVGLWFLNVKLTIPNSRIIAANLVYQFSIFTLIVNVISIPYNSIIIAFERMNIFAWMSILEVFLKLVIVFMLTWFGFDKLTLYAFLVFIISVILRLIYRFYCKSNFPESKFRLLWDKPLFNTLTSYAGWSLWGSTAGILSTQGVNILLNIFFGPVVNAARAIAYQVQGSVNSFVTNFFKRHSCFKYFGSCFV